MSIGLEVAALLVSLIALLGKDKLIQLAKTAFVKCLRLLNFKRAYCASTTWNDLPGGKYLHSHTQQCDPYGSGDASGLKNGHSMEDFLRFFTLVGYPQNPRIFAKPVALDITTKYFRTDLKTLLICFLSTIAVKEYGRLWRYEHDNATDSHVFTYGESFLSLKPKGGSIEATINAPCNKCWKVCERTHTELDLIIGSAQPPWYQEELKNTHDTPFKFPVLGNRNLVRAGWIVAVGLGDAFGSRDDYRVVPFFATRLGTFRPLFLGEHHRDGKGPYWDACRYLKEVVDRRLHAAFPEERELITVAKRAITGLLKDHSGSNIIKYTKETCFNDCDSPGRYTGDLSTSQIEFAIDIFNNAGQMEDGHIDELRGILQPMLAGAIRGLTTVLQYFNNSGFELHEENFRSLMEGNPVVYLRDQEQQQI